MNDCIDSTVAREEALWNSPRELAQAILEQYSVTGLTREQYFEQVKQYPLYMNWLDRILSDPDLEGRVLEVGSGPGIFGEKIAKHPLVSQYTAVEPDHQFAEMTRQATDGRVFEQTIEDFCEPCAEDVIVATAAYHHFNNKPKALKNIYAMLKQGGKLIIADGFIPSYAFDENYLPVDKKEFVGQVLKYAASQIKSMPNPQEEEIVDQIMTAILDMTRIEEKKVCIGILEKQLKEAGFQDINIELMDAGNNVNRSHLGYYYITANKG